MTDKLLDILEKYKTTYEDNEYKEAIEELMKLHNNVRDTKLYELTFLQMKPRIKGVAECGDLTITTVTRIVKKFFKLTENEYERIKNGLKIQHTIKYLDELDSDELLMKGHKPIHDFIMYHCQSHCEDRPLFNEELQASIHVELKYNCVIININNME